jgi:hypothetical protein
MEGKAMTDYLSWNEKLGWHDRRKVAAQKLAAALQLCGLAHLIDVEGWIKDQPERLCLGCIFGEEAWQARLAREARKERRARAAATRPGSSARKKAKASQQP